MSPLNPPSAPSSSFFSCSPTLNLSRVLTRSSTSALNSPPVTRMCSCDFFMLSPLYLHGPPVAMQTKSLRLASRRGASVLANFWLMRESPSTFPAKSSTTAEIAGMPPSRSKSDPVLGPLEGGAAAAAGAPSGGAGLKFAGSGVPVWPDSFSTMSPLNPARAPSSSFCSVCGTLNLFRVLTRSSTRGLTSSAVVPIFLWDSCRLRPLYLHGPPVAKQTKSLRLASRRGALLLANFLLTRESLSTFPAKSSTTAEIASLPPRRSKSDLDGAGAAAGAEATGAPLSPSGGAGLKFAGSSVPVWDDSLSTMSLLNPASAPSSSFCSAAGTLNLFRVLTRSSTSAVNSPAVVPIFLWDSFMLRPVYRQGPPVAKQTKSLRLASSRAGSLLPNFLLMRESASTFPAKSSTTAEIASLPPRRS